MLITFDRGRVYYVDDSGTLKIGYTDGGFFSLVEDTC